MSENWNLQAVSDSKPEAPPEKPPETPETSVPPIPSVLSNDHSLGAIMTMAREARGFSREQAATSSNIPGYYLTMIETDDYSSIADQLYLLPFLRRYAIFVGMEAEEVASRFIRDVQRADMNPGRPSEPITMFEPRRPFPWRLLMTIVVAIVGGTAAWFGYGTFAARKAAMSNAIVPSASASAGTEQGAPEAAGTAPANVAPDPMSAPSMAVVPAAAPSVVAAPAALTSAAASPAAAASAAIVPTAVPHTAPPPFKASPKSAGHAATHPRGPIKSASPPHRISMRD